ncbi:hypothetical protein ACQY0O_004756 [Thecaphora frezii]
MSSAADPAPRARPERGRGRGARGGGRGGPASAGGPRSNRRANFGGSLSTNAPDGGSAPPARRGGRRGSGAGADRGKGKAREVETGDAAADIDGEASGVPAAPAPPPAPASAHDNRATDDDDELPPEGEMCFICAEPVKLYSIAPCDHKTCHICAIRLRALYKKTECTFCKTDIDRLIFTASATKGFGDFEPTDTPFKDAKLNISFETKDAMEETLILLRFNCPDERCEVASAGWQDLKMHARRDHSRLLCDLCVRHKKIFSHEHTLHTSQSLQAHMNKEHGHCEYCNQYFYSDDELFVHMRDRHEQCHICKARGTEAERWRYFRNYAQLERHFQHDHYLCQNPECLEKKFVVFENDMDFKAHQLSEHANELTSREKREAVRIEANFTYDEPEGSRGGRGGRGGRRGGRSGRGERDRDTSATVADDDADPLGVSSLVGRQHVPGAGPSNHSRRAAFGGNLTGGDAPSPQGVSAPETGAAAAAVPMQERHAAYLDKVRAILKGSEARVTSFRSSVRTYRNGEMPAKDLIDNIHALVGDLDDCVNVVNGLADLLDDDDKKRHLLAAWNNFRIERTQFPSLGPVSGDSPYSGIAKGQIRNVKNASASNNQVWANVDRAASSSSGHGAGRPVAIKEHFPSLAKAQSKGSVSIPGSLAHAVATNSSLRANHGSTPWSASSTMAAANRASSGRSTPQPVAAPYVMRAGASSSSSSSSGMTNLSTRNTSAFPSLPTNQSKMELNAHKRAVLGKSKGRESEATSPRGSGASTPWTLPSGRIDESTSPRGSAGQGLQSLDGLNEALAATSRAQQAAAGGGGGSLGAGKKKKGKGTTLISLGGVHRG